MITLDRMNLEDERAILEARNKALAVSKYCDQSETQSCLLVTFCSELARRLIADGDPAQFTILAGKQGEQFGFYVFFSGNEISNLPESLRRFFQARCASEQDCVQEYYVFLAKPNAETTEDIFNEEIRTLLLRNSEPLKLSELSEALAAEKARMSVTLQSIYEGVITIDITGQILQINRAAADFIGFTESEVFEKQVDDILHLVDETDNTVHTNIVSHIFSKRSLVDFGSFTALESREGKRRPVRLTGAPMLNEEDMVSGAVLVLRDVEEERIAASERERSSKLESVGILAGGIAHDFNNYLGVIMGNLELASPHFTDTPAAVSSLLSQAQKAGQRASKLTQQLLTFSKGGDPITETTSLSALIRESVDFALRGSNTSCHCHVPDTLWMANIDSGQVGQVIQNIALNAKQAMPDGGSISISCRNIGDPHLEDSLPFSHGDFVSISITDQGPGITPALIDKIFDPYFTTKATGNGLGLAICHSIVRKHGGHIVATSEVNKGTCFTLYLPATREGQEAGKLQSPSISASQEISVLVMDDDVMVREVIEQQLIALGHSAHLVHDGESAIAKYQQLQVQGKPADLVILDLTIPGGMGGQETAHALLQIDPDAKIVVASGYSNDPIMANYRSNGFVGVIAKPFNLSELSHIVNTAAKK